MRANPMSWLTEEEELEVGKVTLAAANYLKQDLSRGVSHLDLHDLSEKERDFIREAHTLPAALKIVEAKIQALRAGPNDIESWATKERDYLVREWKQRLIDCGPGGQG